MKVVPQFISKRFIEKNAELFQQYFAQFSDPSWHTKTIEDLDSIAATLDVPRHNDGDMERAAKMQALSRGYWMNYQRHLGSEGPGRGQEFQERCYDILYKRLGPWNRYTVGAMEGLCRWDIDSDRRAKLVEECISRTDVLKHKGLIGSDVIKDLVRCCLRNGDYEVENVKTLSNLLIIVYEEEYGEESDPVLLEERILLDILIGRKDLQEAVKLAWKLILAWGQKLGAHFEGSDCRARLAEVKMLQGKLDEAETTLHAAKKVSSGWESLPCCDQVIKLYLEQQRWNEAEKWLQATIETKQSMAGKEQQCRTFKFDRDVWDVARQMAPRVREISIWRGEEQGDIARAVYLLHGLYANEHQLATIYVEQKRFEDARQQLEKLVEHNFHLANPVLMANKNLLVSIYLELGLLDDAERMQEIVVRDMDKIFASESENLEIIPALQKLSDIYRKNNHWGKRHDVQMRLLRFRNR
ncbi:hypothetical protein CPB83DRAFT_897946 [Crepidotus variabilis]|uniref:Tetratricopeptide repeat protein n=1 Tax=Crepidotus variabilis TaxID=179855 RepID=A0A9P6E853_9AGAR|nr:hypothetical protein CPB83DRAFT_897946 [Crepidotus variabilis]